MKKTLQKRTTRPHPSARLPRVSVEVLESRTLLSASPRLEFMHHATANEQGSGARTVPIPAPTSVYVSLMPTGSSSLNIVGLESGGSLAWHVDAQGHAMLSGRIIQISGDGTVTNQPVSITAGDGSTTSTDSKDQNDDGSGNCPQPTQGMTTPGTPTGSPSGKPLFQHPGGSTGSQPGPTPTPPASTPATGPTLADPGSAQPSIARPTQSADSSGNPPPASSGPTVTPLAMTPSGQNFVPLPVSNVAPGSAISNIPNVSSLGISTYSTTNITSNAPAVHDMGHTPGLVTLAAISPPVSFLTGAPIASVAVPVQAATGTVHVSEAIVDDAAPGTYVIASSAPSLPARIAYNFVRLDAAAFHDTARAFAAELAALNVSNNEQSHARAWAITAGVLTADIALLIYWHRQAKLRKQLLKTQPAI